MTSFFEQKNHDRSIRLRNTIARTNTMTRQTYILQRLQTGRSTQDVKTMVRFRQCYKRQEMDYK